ncbi:MAG: TetR/AcrR family transcriptional regulator [Myxococcaceae bacterium]|nr:TetR/AcrR family transcriptional regulator [Myxococcaceae bacterium]MCI0671214.1 TetR/AcrR family transcriptional regulator [Myxococcaceae bacterium]
MSVRAEQKERTHQDILASAIRLLREKGISGASVAEVMKGAGLTVGGFYAHFDSKEALVGASLRQSMREMWSRLLASAGEAKGAEALDIIVRRYLSRGHRDDPALGCPLPAVVGEAAQAGEPVREAIADEVATYADALGEKLGGDRSARRRHGLAILALMYGGVSLARSMKGTPLSDEMLKACRDFAREAFRDS